MVTTVQGLFTNVEMPPTALVVDNGDLLLDLGNTAALADTVRTTTATLDTRIVHLVGLRGLTVAATHRLRIEGCSGPVLLVVDGDVTLDGRLDIEAGCGETAADRWPPTWACGW